MPTKEQQSVFRSWCLRELTYWQAPEMDWPDINDKFSELNIQHKTIFLLDISSESVVIRDKDRFYSRSELDDTKSLNSHISRVNAYRAFIERSVTSAESDVSTTIAMDMNDIPLMRHDIPIFGFQKLRHSPAILLPDIDFLRFNFYLAGEFCDTLSYDRKVPKASFIGSSTGAGIITQKAVLENSVPRIRGARFFKDNPDVDFRIPNIVQCDSKETQDLIRSLGICGELTPFQQQLQNKFIISIDGNGATCSRVALSLKSNSVLLKYDSPYVLYYFDRMLPWIHYIPIEKDADIQNILRVEQHIPGYFRSVAHQGAEFFEKFVSLPNVLQYTSELISMYANIFSQCGRFLDFDSLDSDRVHKHAGPQDPLDLDPILHVQNVGDVYIVEQGWVGLRGGHRAIEGFALRPSDDYLRSNLEYSSFQADLNQTEWSRAGNFCGTRGKNSPIHGISIRIVGPLAHLYDCSYMATCVDGSTANIAKNGELCSGPTYAPLEALNITIRKISDAIT